MTALPKFDAPPVVESAIGVQFEPIKDFSSLHVGWFWREGLGPDWRHVNDASRLEDQFETFDEEQKWHVPGIQVGVGSASLRSRILKNGNERMVQIQNSRFIYNWRKVDANYPTYDTLFPEFKRHFGQFRDFVRMAELSELKPNQWEITYVNHIPKGELWNSPRDWPAIFPGYYIPADRVNQQLFESFAGNWHLILRDNRGRLHIVIQHVKSMFPEEREVLLLQFTARGPVDESSAVELEDGLNLGHEAIVTSFAAITSDDAHKAWHRKI